MTIHNITHLILVASLLTAVCPVSAQDSTPASRWLPVDEEGWTVLKPVADSRIIYVSSSAGDDDTGRVYGPTDNAVGSDPFRPTDQVKPFKSIGGAFTKTGADRPDWVLLKRGDAWLGGVPLKNGRSKSEPSVVASYGATGDRPLLKTGKASGVKLRSKSGQYIVVAGLRFYAHTRDPQSPDYTGPDGKSGFDIYVGKDDTAKGLLLEDCSFKFYQSNVIQGPGVIEDVVIRRCQILDNYSAVSHSQGMYTKNVSLLLEENVFDHNGWLMRQVDRGNDKNDGQATMFNHNTYFCNSHDVTFRGNMFLRASSMGNKWTANYGPASARNLMIDDNLYVEGEIGIGIGGNNPGPCRFKDITISNNVLLNIGRGQPTGRTLGWGIDVLDWDGGSITGNVLVHRKSDIVTNVHSLSVGASDENGLCRDVAVRDNVFSGAPVYYSKQSERLQGISFTDNKTQTLAELAPAGKAERSIESYMASLGREPSLPAFAVELRKQSKANWRFEFTAATVNDWLRQGFDSTH